MFEPGASLPLKRRRVLEGGAMEQWRERWAALRDRWLADARFRRAAARFPFTRPVARRRSRELFHLVAGFAYSQALYACVRLRLFETLLAAPRDLAELAQLTGQPPVALQRLLDVAGSLQLVEPRSGGRYGLGPLGAPLAGMPGVAAMVEHHAALYADLADPLAVLRGEGRGALARVWPYAGAAAPAELAGEAVDGYTRLMAASQPLVAEQVLDAYRFERHRCVLDVGGGDGSFLAAIAAQAPSPRLVLFDLPPVAERARERFAAAGLSDRARCVGGDFLRDSLPAGADLITLVRVVHDHDDADALALLKAARRALGRGGRLLLAEPMVGSGGDEALGAAYFGLYLAAMGRGRPRSPAALRALLREAGFGPVRRLATALPLQCGVLLASPSRW